MAQNAHKLLPNSNRGMLKICLINYFSTWLSKMVYKHNMHRNITLSDANITGQIFCPNLFSWLCTKTIWADVASSKPSSTLNGSIFMNLQNILTAFKSNLEHLVEVMNKRNWCFETEHYYKPMINKLIKLWCYHQLITINQINITVEIWGFWLIAIIYFVTLKLRVLQKNKLHR